MPNELARIAADILIAKIEKTADTDTKAEDIAADFQIIYNQLKIREIEGDMHVKNAKNKSNLSLI